MGEVVRIEVAVERRGVSLEQAWDRYLAAMQKSKETLRIEDGIAAGKAYVDFLDTCARTK
jgi:hypothetical protein